MSNKIMRFILCSTLMLNTILFADLESERLKDREELRAIKEEQLKLQHKERLLKLKNSLKLEESQMQAWEAYAAHMTEKANQKMIMVKQLREQQVQKGTKPSALELAELNVRRLEAQIETAREQKAALSDFYSVLNDEQKTIIDNAAIRKVREVARDLRVKAPKPRKP